MSYRAELMGRSSTAREIGGVLLATAKMVNELRGHVRIIQCVSRAVLLPVYGPFTGPLRQCTEIAYTGLYG
jgi:hypothetical protein